MDAKTKNYTSVEGMLNLPNKEMGHIGSGIVVEDRKIAEKNFSEVKEFRHDKALNDFVSAVPEKPNVIPELKNLGVTAVSNPVFSDHVPVSDQKLSDTEIHLESQKSPTESKTWFAKFLKRTLFHKKNKDLVEDRGGVKVVDMN